MNENVLKLIDKQIKEELKKDNFDVNKLAALFLKAKEFTESRIY